MSNSKVFEQSLFDDCDPPAREVVKKYFADKGVCLVDNPDKYGVDLVAVDGSIKVEVERRIIWKAPEFPFEEVNLLARKAKFFREPTTHYVIVSDDYTHIGGIQGQHLMWHIAHDPTVENPNRFVTAGEKFFKIPKIKFRWVKVSGV